MLYNNFTINLQDKITNKIKKNIKIYVIENILPQIINYRKKYFRKFILHDPTFFRIDLYYFLNLDFMFSRLNISLSEFNSLNSNLSSSDFDPIII